MKVERNNIISTINPICSCHCLIDKLILINRVNLLTSWPAITREPGQLGMAATSMLVILKFKKMLLSFWMLFDHHRHQTKEYWWNMRGQSIECEGWRQHSWKRLINNVSEVCFGLKKPATNFYIWFGKS